MHLKSSQCKNFLILTLAWKIDAKLKPDSWFKSNYIHFYVCPPSSLLENKGVEQIWESRYNALLGYCVVEVKKMSDILLGCSFCFKMFSFKVYFHYELIFYCEYTVCFNSIWTTNFELSLYRFFRRIPFSTVWLSRELLLQKFERRFRVQTNWMALQVWDVVIGGCQFSFSFRVFAELENF